MPEKVAQDETTSPERARAGSEGRMGSSRVYTRDEIESTGDTDLATALHRLGHNPR